MRFSLVCLQCLFLRPRSMQTSRDVVHPDTPTLDAPFQGPRRLEANNLRPLWAHATLPPSEMPRPSPRMFSADLADTSDDAQGGGAVSLFSGGRTRDSKLFKSRAARSLGAVAPEAAPSARRSPYGERGPHESAATWRAHSAPLGERPGAPTCDHTREPRPATQSASGGNARVMLCVRARGVLGWIRGPAGVDPESIRGRVWVRLGSIWGRCGLHTWVNPGSVRRRSQASAADAGVRISSVQARCWVLGRAETCDRHRSAEFTPELAHFVAT